MSDDAPTQEQMSSAIWRICNIYSIKDRHGKKIPFRPTVQQKAILRAVYIERKKKLFIPKARQLGISTLVAIMILDAILFGSGVQCSICDFVSGNAKKKLEGKIVYAFEQLPPEWRMGWEVVTHNKQSGEFRLKKTGADVSDESVVFAGDQPRGDTYQILHLSELGETQVKAPERAREIFEGALPTAEASLIIIETTWHGGRVGVLYSLVLDAMETPDHKKDKERDYFVMFFPWYQEALYTNAGDVSQVTTQTREYFDSLASILPGAEFTPGQMLWYQKQKDRLGHRIYSLYPSRLEEIFLSPVDGAIYAKEIDEARVSGRVGMFKHDPAKPVDTLWDFGSPQNTICLYFQQDGAHFNFIDADVIETKTASGVEINGYDITFPARMQMMMAKPYRYGTHYIPHDGGSRDLRQRTTWQADMASNGLQGKITVIPRTDDRWLGINKIKAEFPTFRFDAVMMKPWLDGAAMYRLRPDPSDPKKFLSDPIHDFASHLCLDGDTIIATDRGEVAIKDMATNDKVILGDVKADVEWVGPTTFQEVIEMSFDDGSKLITSPSHYLFTTKGIARSDSMRIGGEVWTPHHPQFNYLTHSPLATRAAFVELSTEQGTGYGSNGTCIAANKAENKGFSIESFMSYATRLASTARQKCSQLVTGMISRLRTGTSGQNVKAEKLNQSIHALNLTEESSIANRLDTTAISNQTPACTAPYGSLKTALSRKEWTFTTRTKTRKITTSQTSPFSVGRITPSCIARLIHGSLGVDALRICEAKACEKRLPLGMPRQQELSRIGDWQQNQWPSVHWWNANARSAKRHTNPYSQQEANFAPPNAGLAQEKDGRMRQRRDNVNVALASSPYQSEKSKFIAIQSAKESMQRGLRQNASGKRIVSINRLPPRQLYDMTVKDHHAYVANGVLVSNCDPLRVLGEGLLKNYISASSIMDTNIVLDPLILSKATAEAAKPDTGEILEHQNRCGFKCDPAGWMQKWETPAIGSRYLVVIHKNAVQVWRAARDTSEPQDRATMAASIKVDGRQDSDVLIDRACQLAKFYGDCLVIPTINDSDRIVRDILDRECSIFKRRVKDSSRPIGRSLPPPKMGYDLDAQTRESNISILTRAFREEKIVIHDTQWLMQAGTFILRDDGSKVAQEGYSDAQIMASSIAVSLLDMASEYGHCSSQGNSLIRMG